MAGSNVQRATSQQKIHKRYAERLGAKVSKRLNAEKLSYTVTVHAVVPTPVVGHILKVTKETVQIHNIRKSGSQKMDVSFLPMSDIIAIEGKQDELGQVVMMREAMIEEYKNVQVKASAEGVYQITNAAGETYIINSKVAGVRVEVTADASEAASAPAKKSKDAKEGKKTTKKLAKKKKKTDDDEDM